MKVTGQDTVNTVRHCVIYSTHLDSGGYFSSDGNPSTGLIIQLVEQVLQHASSWPFYLFLVPQHQIPIIPTAELHRGDSCAGQHLQLPDDWRNVLMILQQRRDGDIMIKVLSECYTSVIIIFCLLTGMSNWTFSFCGSPFFNFTFMGFIARCPAPVLLHIIVTGGCPWTWIWPIKERDANKSVNKRKLVIHDHSDSIIELKERENKDIFWHFLWDWEKKGKKKMIKSREE